MSHYYRHAQDAASWTRPRNGLGFWDALVDAGGEFADDAFAADFGADFFTDFSALTLPEFSMENLAGDFIPADYAGDLAYQYADVVDNYSGDVDTGVVIDGEYTPAPYAGDEQYEYADRNDYVNSPAEDASATPDAAPRVPSVPIPSTPSAPSGNTSIPPASRGTVPSTRAGNDGVDVLNSVLTRAVEVTPRILDIVTTTQRRQAEIDTRQAELDRWREVTNPTRPTTGFPPKTVTAGGGIFPSLDSVIASVKENPLPWALGAGALALLLFSRKSKSRSITFRTRYARRAHLRRGKS